MRFEYALYDLMRPCHLPHYVLILLRSLQSNEKESSFGTCAEELKSAVGIDTDPFGCAIFRDDLELLLLPAGGDDLAGGIRALPGPATARRS